MALAKIVTAAAGVLLREHRLLLALVAGGLVLRSLLAVWFWPVHGGFLDSSAILNQTAFGIFRDPLRLPGYPFLIRIIGVAWPHVFAVVLVQYAFGIATAGLLYWLVWRLTDSTVGAAIPAAYVLLAGDHLIVEHSILGETSVNMFTTAALTLWVVASHSERRWLWVLTGAAFTVAATIRFGPIVLVAALLATMLLTSGTPKARAGRAGLMLAGALPLLLMWSVAQGQSVGRWVPGFQATGWSLYSRVASFADCTKTDVDADLRFLCEDPSLIEDPNVAERRGGAGFYLYQGGPAVERFGAPTEIAAPGADVLQRFAIAVIVQQPVDYVRVVASDSLRYFDRNIGYDRFFSGANADEEDISRRDPDGAEAALDRTGTATEFEVPDFDVEESVILLEDWQRITRLSGLALLAVLLLGAWAVLRAGPGRREALLLMGTGIFFAALPALTQTTAYRHSIPVFYLLIAAAGIAVGRLLSQRSAAAAPSVPQDDRIDAAVPVRSTQ